MPVKKNDKEKNTSTEEKIKAAARIVFHKKGFSATRTRDIAEEADINLALLNYYYRSKEKLFDIIMFETLQDFIKSISAVFNNEQTSLETKIEEITDAYIEMMIANPNIPMFLLNELKTAPEKIATKIGMKEILLQSVFIRQFQEGIKTGKIVKINPFQFMMNLMSMIIFPFVARSIIKGLGDMTQEEFDNLMKERKKLIPTWMKNNFIIQ